MKKLITKKNILKLADLRITTACLLLLFFLTLWGTFYQYEYGLFAAQKKFFQSWFFTIFDFIPFIGTKTILLVLTVNLLAATFRYQYKWSKAGIIIIHYGLIFLCFSSFYTHYFSQESVIVIEENQTLNYSLDYYDSELAIHEQKNSEKDVASYDINQIKDRLGERINFDRFDVVVTPVYVYSHARPGTFKDQVENASGIFSLNYLPLPKERERTLPGGVFEVSSKDGTIKKKILLWEGEVRPLVLDWQGKKLAFQIQRKHYPLPFEINLVDFKKEEHQGTAIAKTYQSEVRYIKDDNTFPVLIAMNEPLRSDGYTLFQSSFSVDESGNQRSVLSTVKNQGYYLPYVASLVISFGLLFHFLLMLFRRLKR